MAQLVLRVRETVYHNITRHVPRLVGTSGRTKARLETVVCEPSVRECKTLEFMKLYMVSKIEV